VTYSIKKFFDTSMISKPSLLMSMVTSAFTFQATEAMAAIQAPLAGTVLAQPDLWSEVSNQAQSSPDINYAALSAAAISVALVN
jgi:hypothetical protein